MIARAVAESQEALRQALLQHPQIDTLWVGFSGGLDSTALLWLVHQAAPELRPSLKLRALHVNHNLQPEAASWVEHCRSVCAHLDIELTAVSVKPASASEESARDARYHAFEQEIGERDLLLLAHHRDDQAETFVMRLFRGSGVHGLAAMEHSRVLGRGRLLRPLLNLSREQLETVVAVSGLAWIEDPSNQNSDYLRNWVRNRLSELLAQRWPDWRAKLASTAAWCDEASQLNADLAQIDAGGRFTNPQPITETLFSSKRRLNNLIFYWLRAQGVRPASRSQLEEVAVQIIDGKSGSWYFGQQSLHLYQQQLWLEKGACLPLQAQVLLLQPGEAKLSSGILEIQSSEYGLAPGLQVLVRPRKEGDLVSLNVGTQSLKKFMNAQKVPPWLRDSWPVIEIEGQIISVVGLWYAESWQTKGGLALNWRR